MFFVGNGYVSIVIYSDIVYVLGVFNGLVCFKKYLIYFVYFYEYMYWVCVLFIVLVNFKVELGILGKILYVLDVGEGVFYKWFKLELLKVE